MRDDEVGESGYSDRVHVLVLQVQLMALYLGKVRHNEHVLPLECKEVTRLGAGSEAWIRVEALLTQIELLRLKLFLVKLMLGEFLVFAATLIRRVRTGA